jgi:hypothetical protein
MKKKSPSPSKNTTTLPSGTESAIKREQWNQLTRRLKDGNHLPKSDWQTFLALTRELSQASPDVDWFKLAEEAGAFTKNRVPRTNPAEMALRVNTVADWITWQWTDGQMCHEARQRWGVGRDAVVLYRIRAAKIISERAEVHHDEMFAQAQDLIRHLSTMGKQGDADALNNAISHLRRMGGLDRPVVQEIRMANVGDQPLV